MYLFLLKWSTRLAVFACLVLFSLAILVQLILYKLSFSFTFAQVTIEDHPHLPGKHASIHPCRHGAVMKKIVDVLMSNGVEPEVDRCYCLLMFLIT